MCAKVIECAGAARLHRSVSLTCLCLTCVCLSHLCVSVSLVYVSVTFLCLSHLRLSILARSFTLSLFHSFTLALESTLPHRAHTPSPCTHSHPCVHGMSRIRKLPYRLSVDIALHVCLWTQRCVMMQSLCLMMQFTCSLSCSLSTYSII